MSDDGRDAVGRVSCGIEGCDGDPAFMPIFQIPDGKDGLCGVAFSLIVCAVCKMTIEKDQILTDGGREQIEAAVYGKLGITINWFDVELNWDPVPAPGEGGGGPHFEAHYNTDDPELKDVWEDAVDFFNAFVAKSGGDENKIGTRITALGVVALCGGYKRYRAEDLAGGQMFLASLMRSVADQLEGQYGDKVKIEVAVTTKDPLER